MYPRFLGIGAQKAGTTWLYENLRRHPSLWLPPVKELHYLDQKPPRLTKRLFGKATPMRTAREHLRAQLLELARGRGDRHELAWAARYCLLPRSDAWYRSLFPEGGDRMPGEICPGYARLDAEAVGEVKRRMPDARILYLLRDPIDRSWSTSAMHFRKPRFGRIAEYSDAEIEAHFKRDKTARHDDYLGNLASWSQHYGAEQLFVGFYDDLLADPRALLVRVLTFLGVDASDRAIPPDVASRRNAGEGEVIPERFARFLARHHYARICALDEHFSNPHTKRWRQRAEQLIT
jgi:hypothetical protein